MGSGMDSHELWRKNAARQWQDDRYTVLFSELVEAHDDRETGSVELGIYFGLRLAYCLLTGDSVEAVELQVASAAQGLVAS